jgi:hypothetical protein
MAYNGDGNAALAMWCLVLTLVLLAIALLGAAARAVATRRGATPISWGLVTTVMLAVPWALVLRYSVN